MTGHAIALATSIVAVLFSCGTLAFLAPTTAGVALAMAGWRMHGATVSTNPRPIATRGPPALPQLFSSKEIPPGASDISDSSVNEGSPMITDDELAEIRQEVLMQVPIADEMEARMAAQEMEDKKYGIKPVEDDFEISISEGEQGALPAIRRVYQLTFLVLATQITACFYFLGLQWLTGHTLSWLRTLAQDLKAGNVRLPGLLS